MRFLHPAVFNAFLFFWMWQGSATQVFLKEESPGKCITKGTDLKNHVNKGCSGFGSQDKVLHIGPGRIKLKHLSLAKYFWLHFMKVKRH